MKRPTPPIIFALALVSALALLQGCSGTPTTKPADKATTPPATNKDLPKSYTHYVVGYQSPRVPIEMVLVPGDATTGIKPFYVGRTEVTWDMLLRWVYGMDIDNSKQRWEEEKIGLRPSYLDMGHPQTDLHMIGEKDWPAIGLTWRTARGYCLWLSKQTGHTYRLPTDTEWRHMLMLRGGLPGDEAELLKQGVFADNAEEHEIAWVPLPRAVAQGPPDALGLYDFLGNAAEWVQPMAGKRWVRGGSYITHAKGFTADWRAVEDQTVWNASYPVIPVSQSWYMDRIDQGFRVVRETE